MNKEIILYSGLSFQQAFDSIEELREEVLNNKDYKPRVMTIRGLEAWKTAKQNNTFHDLLDIFWFSKCSSFISYDKMRQHYKKFAGLIKVLYDNTLISDEGKKLIWNACKNLPLSVDDMSGFIELMKGRIEQETSWSEAKKENARLTLGLLIENMFQSAVQDSEVGKKFQKKIEEIEKDKNSRFK